MTSLYHRLGSLTLPPDLGAVEEARTLTALDPARRVLIDLFKAAVNAELGEAWQAAMFGKNPDGAISATLPVADTLELRPLRRIVQERACKFPLLAVYRDGQAEDAQDEIDEPTLKQPWSVDWILGPADVATKFQLGDAAVAASKIIRRICRLGAHPDYQGGALQFGSDTDSGLQSIRWVNHQGPGEAPFADDREGQSYLAISIALETLERDSFISGGSECPLDGASYDLGIGSLDGVIPHIMQSETEHPGT